MKRLSSGKRVLEEHFLLSLGAGGKFVVKEKTNNEKWFKPYCGVYEVPLSQIFFCWSVHCSLDLGKDLGFVTENVLSLTSNICQNVWNHANLMPCQYFCRLLLFLDTFCDLEVCTVNELIDPLSPLSRIKARTITQQNSDLSDFKVDTVLVPAAHAIILYKKPKRPVCQ